MSLAAALAIVLHSALPLVEQDAPAPHGLVAFSRFEDPEGDRIRLARSRTIRDTLVAWKAGGDASEAIGALRGVLADEPRSLCRFDLARILQAEGRTREAVDEYWRACHQPVRNRTTNPIASAYPMVRIADALEDVGRTEDAVWAFAQTKRPNRREAYLEAMGGAPAEWQRKWARKLLKDDPRDERALGWLETAEETIRRASEEGRRRSRDVPNPS